MKLLLPCIVALTEMRLRLRRLSSLVTVLAVIVLAWTMIPDPQSGTTLLAIKNARVLYSSSALALGSASLASFLFGLAGFYLARGRIAEDMRSGAGSVIAATSASNAGFLFGRWLGGVVYLLSLILAFLLAMLVCHALRGDGPIEISVYLLTYAALMLPMVLFVVSCAVLFDSFSPLMGKLGEVIFFFIWIAQIALMEKADKALAGQVNIYMVVDFIGTATSMVNLKAMVGTEHLSLGIASFDSRLASILLPAQLWSSKMLALRALTTALAVIPLLPSFILFHRFSPDRVKMTQASKRRSPLTYLNQLLRPFSRLAQPCFHLAQSLPGMTGQVTADLALTLVMTPMAGLALLALPLLSLLSTYGALPGLLTICVASWGILISDISCRDHQNACQEITGVVPGGIAQRYLRHFITAALLGLLMMGVIVLRWSMHEPLRALVLLSGIASMSGAASLAGRLSGTSRTFLALFLFGLYVAVNATKVPMIDVFGFNGAANVQTILTQCVITVLSLFGGYWYNQRRLT